MTIKRPIVLVLLGAGIVIAIWKFAGTGDPMRDRCSEMCDRMLENMPESFPPNRMMADLDTLKERTAHILELMERQEEGDRSDV